MAEEKEEALTNEQLIAILLTKHPKAKVKADADDYQYSGDVLRVTGGESETDSICIEFG